MTGSGAQPLDARVDSNTGGLDRLLLFNLAVDSADPILGFTTEWLRALARRVRKIDVITMRAGIIEVESNVTVWSLGKEHGYTEPRRALRFYRILLELLRRHHYDACFAHMAPLFAAMAAVPLRGYAVPLTLWAANESQGPVLRLGAAVSNTVITPAHGSFRVPSKRLVVTGHGIDTAQMRRCPSADVQDAFTIGYVGRITPPKQIDLLLRAVAEVRRAGCLNISLRITGPVYESRDSGYARELESLATDLGISECVTWVGSLPRGAMPRELSRLDVLVNLLRHSLDKSVLEGMSCGVPVVSCATSCVKLLNSVEPRLSLGPQVVDDLSQALLWLYALPRAERQALGDRLRQYVVEHHSLERLADLLVTRILPQDGRDRSASPAPSA